MPCIADYAAALLADFMCGANREGFHYSGANWERDAALTDAADLREIAAGDLAPEGAWLEAGSGGIGGKAHQSRAAGPRL